MEAPTNNEVAEARIAAGLSQEAAAALIQSKRRTWQDWEAGIAKMHAGLWELFLLKTKKTRAKVEAEARS